MGLGTNPYELYTYTTESLLELLHNPLQPLEALGTENHHLLCFNYRVKMWNLVEQVLSSGLGL